MVAFEIDFFVVNIEVIKNDGMKDEPGLLR
jgi:hypothetical protein